MQNIANFQWSRVSYNLSMQKMDTIWFSMTTPSHPPKTKNRVVYNNSDKYIEVLRGHITQV